MGSSPAVGPNPKSEPVSIDLMACCTRSSSHTVATCCGCTNIPRTARGAQEAGTILSVGCGGQRPFRFGHLDPAGLISLCGWGQIVADAAFITAPSMTTPAVVYRHRAIRSLRARATMIVLRIRPPRRWTPLVEPQAERRGRLV